MALFFRTDSAARRTAANCLLAAVLAVAVVVFFSCRRHMAVPGTPQMDISTKYQIRVLLAGDVNHATLQIHGSFSVLNSSGEATIPDTIFADHSAPMEVAVSNQGLFIAGRCFAADQITILPDDPYIFKFDGAGYRGKLVLKAKAGNATFDAINVVPLEPYLAGVVGAEMPERWEIEALKAQAIAARTYCLFNKEKFSGTRGWDVTRTAASQVYLGLKAESAKVWKAVNDTTGRILVCRQDGFIEEIFPTYYSSTCGGHTENSKNIFGDSYGPLCGVDCPYCKGVARLDIFFWPMVKFDQNTVQAAVMRKYPKLKELCDINDIAPSRQSDYNDFSRLTMIKLTDSNSKSDYLRAEDLRLTIDPSGNKLRSTICKIIRMDKNWVFLNGRGFGHGVGLCQYGAQGMALQGRTAEEILAHYYPGSRMVNAY